MDTALKIDPEFAAKCPPLTEEEFQQLQDNILSEGIVLTPLIVWDGIIVDGHNRYQIIQEHPEIKYSTYEKQFDNRYAAISWICKNQLGRRNLTPQQRKYLIGQRYEAEKNASSFRGNQYTLPSESGCGQNGHNQNTVNTRQRIAEESHTNDSYVKRASQYAQGVDAAEAVLPGIKNELLSGTIKPAEQEVAAIAKAAPEERLQIVEELRKPKPKPPTKEKPPTLTARQQARQNLQAVREIYADMLTPSEKVGEDSILETLHGTVTDMIRICDTLFADFPRLLTDSTYKAKVIAIMNETYSRDISKKVSSALEAKERRGEFVGVWASYGYSKSPENSHQLVINPETAPIIREIFALRLTGAGYGAIMRSLNDREIPSPSAYLYQTGLSRCEKYRDTLWSIWNIKEILRNETYIGNLVQGKRTQRTYKQAWDTRYAPSDTWRIVKGTHEAIIDEATFQAVQEIGARRKAAYDSSLGQWDDLKTPNLFRGLIFCADCGRAMTRSQVYSNWGDKRVYYYTYKCPTAMRKASACTAKNLPETDLLEVVRDTLHNHLQAVTELEKRIATIAETRINAQEQAVAAQIAAAKKGLARYASLRDGLYQNLVDGIVSRQEYLAMKEKYQSKCEEIESRIQTLYREKESVKRFSPENAMFAAWNKFKDITVLSEEMMHALISRIEVCEDKSLRIALTYRDEFAALTNYVMEEAK